MFSTGVTSTFPMVLLQGQCQQLRWDGFVIGNRDTIQDIVFDHLHEDFGRFFDQRDP